MVDRNLIDLAAIVLDWTFYPRTEVSRETVMRLKEAIASGTRIPPVIIDKKTMKLIDGFHRYEAYKGLKANKIPAELRTYKDEREMIEDVGALNSDHGRPFSSQDCRRFILLASDVGLSKEKIAGILHVTRERIEGWMIQRATFKNEEIPIKRGLHYLVGKKLTEGQRKLNKEWGGMNATFYINQLILYLEAGGLRSDDRNFIEKMERLMKSWEEAKRKIKIKI